MNMAKLDMTVGIFMLAGILCLVSSAQALASGLKQPKSVKPPA